MAQRKKLSYHFLTMHLLLISVLSFSKPNSETDILALLSFKSQIYADPLGVFSSWNQSLHHCQWQGVLCGERHPDRVVALVLDSKQLSGSVSPSLANLTFLQKISLSDNKLQGEIPVELGYLLRLRSVNLSINLFEGGIPSTFGNCSNLKVIYLNNNNLQGTIPANLAQCKELRIINLGNNFLTGGIPPEFGLISKLLILSLRINNLTGPVPSTLGSLSSLQHLLLDQNNLGGQIPDSLGKLLSLSHLYLYKNKFTGSIPHSFGNLTNLSYLDLNTNTLNGRIPPVLGNLTNLLFLSLRQNRFSGTVPSDLGNLNNLQILYLNRNRLHGFIPDALGKLQNLQSFIIYDNKLSGEIPQSLYNISTMITLSLGYNNLEGTLPLDICDATPNLQHFALAVNQLSGQVPPSISNCSALTHLLLDTNFFSGKIPSTIGKLKNLQYFIVAENLLEANRYPDWSFIDALANCTYLEGLYLETNQLQGVMPSSIANLSTSLQVLSISNNPISGSIPTELQKFTNLTSLDLGNMLLSGTFSEQIGKLFRLEYLDVSNNAISGQIPPTFDNLTKMTQLFLNDNALEGSIPPELVSMHSLFILNLSNNKLIGEIPKEIMGLSSLSISLDLSHNYLTVVPPEIGNLKNLQNIRLSNNKLIGELPSTIGECQELQALYLDYNLFKGTIPSSWSNLASLQVLDVSNNSFSGQVPEFIGRMNLQYLNISFNNFEGELPRGGIFNNISGLDVRGNPKLCGGVPVMHLLHCNPKSSTPRHNPQKYIVLICSITGSCIFITIVTYLVVTSYSRRKSPNNDRTLEYKKMHVSYNDLVKATESFSINNLIGRGTFGTVYKAVMSFENTITVAVKVISLQQHGATRSFFSECEALRNVRHRNLIKVLSSCSSIDHQGNDFKALVFEYMSNGSLEVWLHPNSCTDLLARSLNISQRLNIAIDVATALDYLHSQGLMQIVHCDLKPSNILLDDDMVAKVGDFGLARFLVQPDTMPSQSIASNDRIKGSIGYIPPEYGMGGQPSVEGDVYSYGILLLEMFTGVSPTDERFRDGLNLHKHIEMAFPEHVMDMVDPKLFSQTNENDNPHAHENVYNCLVSVFQCGILCCKESPKTRISIKDVLKELDSAKKKLLEPWRQRE